MQNELPDSAFWKRKLAGLLHDPPSKALDVANHEQRSAAAYARAGFAEEEIQKFHQESDWTAAAADRFPFPDHRSSQLRCSFDGRANTFRHPLSGSSHLRFTQKVTTEDAAEVEASLQTAFDEFPADWSAAETARARFFAHWRLWERHCAETGNRASGNLAWLPADTRLPDHSIWDHMQIVSALSGCADSHHKGSGFAPAFLKLQIGPVQDFIAAARTTRDLWSGSYLLSWIIAHGLKTVSALAGPDAVIFPNLRNQPLFDYLWKEEMWDHVQLPGMGSAWEHSLKPDDASLLTPNLPNVFFAVVPASRARSIAKAVEEAIRNEWQNIGDAVSHHLQRFFETSPHQTELQAEFPLEERLQRIDRQRQKQLSIDWQCLPWPESQPELKELAAHLPPAPSGTPDVVQLHQKVVTAVTETIPHSHRRKAFYTDDSKTVLNNLGSAWSLLYALNAWALDAVRQVRHFPAAQAGGWQRGTFQNKDALNGREEAVAGGRKWRDACAAEPSMARLFRHEDWLGASTLIKRLWPVVYLQQSHGLRLPPMPCTQHLAGHRQKADTFDKEDDPHDNTASSSGAYYAVLAFDGDQIGRWVAGTADNFPTWGSQLADYTDPSGQRAGARAYFEEHLPDLLNQQRPVTPSYHLQLSKALSNFANFAVRRVVECHHGKLIYAGGDDVLAMLPADTAVACAADLRRAFRGEAVPAAGLRQPKGADAGFLMIDNPAAGEPESTLLMPGPAMEVSAGIAIAHFKAPLQDTVRAAHAAEKRAKRSPAEGGEGRAAIAITLLKRSGEEIHWGGPWKAGTVESLQSLITAIGRSVSHQFPQNLAALMERYFSHGAGTGGLPQEQAHAIILRELDHVLSRQGITGQREDQMQLRQSITRYLELLPPADQGVPTESDRPFHKVQGLCASAAFIARNPQPTQPQD